VRPFTAEVKIVGLKAQAVKTSAGSFRVVEIQRTDKGLDSSVSTAFYSPVTKSLVRATGLFPSNLRVELELVAYGRTPKETPTVAKASALDPWMYERDWKRVEAPVYEDGDWWVFRVSIDGESPWDHEVTYREGRFERSDRLFSKTPPSTEVVNSEDSEDRDLDFPLVPGKTWSFRKKTRDAVSGRHGVLLRNVEVVGPIAQPLETPAGEFQVVELQGESLFSFGVSKARYFYSPRTKSVVRILGDIVPWGTSNKRFEAKVELIAYGSEATHTDIPVARRPSVGRQSKRTSTKLE